MPITFTTTLLKDEGLNATGIEVPAEVVAALGKGKKPPVVVMGSAFMLPLSQERRAAAGVEAGDEIEVTLELDTEPRTVEVPDDLAAALVEKPGARAAFDALSYSARKEHVRQVESAKAAETRSRRIASIVEKMGSA